MEAESLRALLSAEAAASFTPDAWPKVPIVVSGSVARWRGLAELTLEQLIAMDKSHTTATVQTLDGAQKPIRLKAEQETGLHAAGAALDFYSLNSSALRPWIVALERDLHLLEGTMRVDASTCRRSEGLAPRFAAEDHFVCQVRGTQRLRIAVNADDAFREPAVSQTVDLTPGTAMFLPRGAWHAAMSAEETLHVTILPGLPTAREVLEYLFLSSAVLAHPGLRGPIPRVFDGEKSRAGVDEALKNTLQEVVRAICAQDLDLSRDGLQNYLRKRRGS
jgi:50S ribosomal protein L16 3-hydroxylase